MEPSRCRCSSAFGREAIRSESKGGVIRERSVRQLRAAGVFPCRKPERADIRGRVGKLANPNRRRLIVKAVVIFVVEGALASTRVAVGKKNGFQPAMRAEASFERAIGRIADEDSIVRAHGKKRRITVNQRGPETLVDSRLGTQTSVEVIGRVEWIVRFGHVICEDGGVQSRFVPFSGLHRFGQFFAVHANLPGKKTIGIQFRFTEFGYCGSIAARQGFEWESPVLVEKNEMIAALRGRLGDGIERIGNVLRQHRAAGFEEPAKLRRKSFERVYGFIDDQSLTVSSPGEGMIGEQEAEHSKENDGSGPSPRPCYEPSPHHEIPLCVVGGAQRAALAPVVVINHKTNGHPHEKADPIHDGEAGHQREASKNRKNRSNGPSGRAKGSMAIRFAIAENQHASSNQSKGKKRSNVREISEGSDIEETRGNAHNKTSHPRGEVRRLIPRVNAPKNPGEKTVAGHREPNTRLANLEHQ